MRINEVTSGVCFLFAHGRDVLTHFLKKIMNHFIAVAKMISMELTEIYLAELKVFLEEFS